MTYQKSKVSFVLLAIMAVALTGTLSSMDTAQADRTIYQKTKEISNFRTGEEVCNFNESDRYYHGITEQSIGHIKAVVKDNNDSGVTTAYIWKTMRLNSGDEIKLSVTADTKTEVDNGNVHIAAYIAKKSTMYRNNLGCYGNGAAMQGDDGTAFLVSQTTNGNTNTTDDYAEINDVIKITRTGLYNIVVYADASSKSNGGDLLAEASNAVVKLDYKKSYYYR